MLFQLLLLLSSQQKKKINLRHNNEIGSTQDEQGESAWNCDVHLNHQEIDQTFLEDEKGNSSEDFETFAFEFAKWFPRDETSRAFKEFDIEELLKKIELDDSTFTVIGFNEFPYTNGLKLKGHNMQVEREYWLRLRKVNKRIAGEDNLVILHVHYQGKWHPTPKSRDRSVIMQVNIRHTTRVEKEAFPLKCSDLDKWREKHGTSIIKQIPKTGWRWRENDTVCRAVHKILIRAEKCTRHVRSLNIKNERFLPDPLPGRRALIVIVEKYISGELCNLTNALQDGVILKAALIRLGWEVRSDYNLGLKDLWDTINTFADEVKDNADACLFAWVGHGIEVRGVQYLVPGDARFGDQEYENPHDFEESVQESCVAFDDLWKCFSGVRNGSQHTLFVFDCCRNDIGQCAPTNLTRRSASDFACSVENAFIVFSTSSGSVAGDGEPGHGGPFMGKFVTEIEREGVSIDEALTNTRAQLKAESSSHLSPSVSTSTSSFCFNPCPQQGGPLFPAPGAAMDPALARPLAPTTATAAGTNQILEHQPSST